MERTLVVQLLYVYILKKGLRRGQTKATSKDGHLGFSQHYFKVSWQLLL